MAGKKDKLIRIKFLQGYVALIQQQADEAVWDALMQGRTNFDHLMLSGDEYPEIAVPVEIVAVVTGNKIKFEADVEIVYDPISEKYSIRYEIDEELIEQYGSDLENWLQKQNQNVFDRLLAWQSSEIQKALGGMLPEEVALT